MPSNWKTTDVVPVENERVTLTYDISLWQTKLKKGTFVSSTAQRICWLRISVQNRYKVNNSEFSVIWSLTLMIHKRKTMLKQKIWLRRSRLTLVLTQLWKVGPSVNCRSVLNIKICVRTRTYYALVQEKHDWNDEYLLEKQDWNMNTAWLKSYSLDH